MKWTNCWCHTKKLELAREITNRTLTNRRNLCRGRITYDATSLWRQNNFDLIVNIRPKFFIHLMTFQTNIANIFFILMKKKSARIRLMTVTVLSRVYKAWNNIVAVVFIFNFTDSQSCYFHEKIWNSFRNSKLTKFKVYLKEIYGIAMLAKFA